MKNLLIVLCFFCSGIAFQPCLLSQATEIKLQDVAGAKQIEVIDINQDQQDDIVFSTGALLLVKYKNGTGYDPYVTLANGSAERFQLVDTDKDGDLDILRAGTNYIYLHEHINGQYEDPVEVGYVIGVKDFFVGDFNGDQWPDIVAGAGTDGLQNDKRLIYLQNNQANNFGINVLGTNLSYILGVEGIDADEDQDLDLMVYFSSQGKFRMYTNDGQGSFTMAGEIDAPEGVAFMESADLNQDAATDLVIGIRDWHNSILYVYYNQPDLAWSQSTIRNFEHTGSIGVVSTRVIDFDDDGDQDIYYTNSYFSELHVVINKPSGLTDSLIYDENEWGRIIQAIGVGKVNNDHLLDAVYYSYTSSEKYLATVTDPTTAVYPVDIDFETLPCSPNPSINFFSIPDDILHLGDVEMVAYDLTGLAIPLIPLNGIVHHTLLPGFYVVMARVGNQSFVSKLIVERGK
jgi:hypothetical protein